MKSNKKGLVIRTKLVILSVILGITSLLFTYLFLIMPYPELDSFLQQAYSTRLLDRHGNDLGSVPLEQGMRREYCTLDQIPKHVIDAFILSEDKRFFWHAGFDGIAFLRAIGQNNANKRIVSGASTITMQLARLVKKQRNNDVFDKISEVFDAVRLELRLQKKQILELYLNNIPFGNQIEGISSASQFFFNSKIVTINPEQALLLSVIPRRPIQYDPITNFEVASLRAHQTSADIGFTDKYHVSPNLNNFKNKLLVVKKGSIGNTIHNSSIPHLARYLFNNYPTILKQTEVKTTIDKNLQTISMLELNNVINTYREQRITNGSIVVFDLNSQELVSYIGSADFWSTRDNGQIDGVHVLNQPGSCLKPFLYSLAFEKGFSPNSILPDIPMDFGSKNVYIPQNYNRRYNGPVRLRTALASSLNIPAVYTLQRLGVSAFSDYLIKLGFNSLEKQRNNLGLGLALGNAELSLWELTKAFAVFPRGGKQLNERMFTDIKREDSDEKQLIPFDIATQICDILSDNSSRFTGFGASSIMNTRFPSMFKTGTANQFQHVWALAASPNYVIGVWLGNFKGDTIIGKTGSSIPAMLAANILTHLELPSAKTKKTAFPRTHNVALHTICNLSGMKATMYCPSSSSEKLSHNQMISSCTWHRNNPSNNEVDVYYPEEFQNWLKDSNYSENVVNNVQFSSNFEIVSPLEGAHYYYDANLPAETQGIILETKGNITNTCYVWLNNKRLGLLPIDEKLFIPLTPGENFLRIEQENTIIASVNWTVFGNKE